jgi:hypothetical protein
MARIFYRNKNVACGRFFVFLFSVSRLSVQFIRTGNIQGVLMDSSGVVGVTLTEQHGIQKVMGLAE